MRTLVIDSSTMSLSIALLDGTKLISEFTTNTKIQHSTQMMPLIDTMFNTVKWLPESLERIIVTKGPGSYTGLRIGVTAAKTLARALNIPLYSVSSLEALAINADPAYCHVFPFIDARRETVFAAAFARQSFQKWRTVGSVGHYDFSDWLEQIAALNLTDKLYFISPDWQGFENQINEKFGSQAIIAPEINSLIKAGRLAALPLNEEDIDTFIPDYAKLAEAEENWRAQNQDKVSLTGEDYIERTN